MAFNDLKQSDQLLVVGFVLVGGLWLFQKASEEPDPPSPPPPVLVVPGRTPPGGDLDCADFNGPVYVGDYDPHYLDADNDGVGCELTP